MVVRRILSRSIGVESSLPREAIFQTRCTIAKKVCSLIIDGGSSSNFVSQLVVEKLQLPTVPHQSPYVIKWLCEGKGISVSHRVLLSFSIGKTYVEELWCDVLPMDVCHVLLGRPWLYDRRVIHDGYLNTYTFPFNNQKIVLTSMPLSQGLTPVKTIGSEIPCGVCPRKKNAEVVKPIMYDNSCLDVVFTSEKPNNSEIVQEACQPNEDGKPLPLERHPLTKQVLENYDHEVTMRAPSGTNTPDLDVLAQFSEMKSANFSSPICPVISIGMYSYSTVVTKCNGWRTSRFLLWVRSVVGDGEEDHVNKWLLMGNIHQRSIWTLKIIFHHKSKFLFGPQSCFRLLANGYPPEIPPEPPPMQAIQCMIDSMVCSDDMFSKFEDKLF